MVIIVLKNTQKRDQAEIHQSAYNQPSFYNSEKLCTQMPLYHSGASKTFISCRSSAISWLFRHEFGSDIASTMFGLLAVSERDIKNTRYPEYIHTYGIMLRWCKRNPYSGGAQCSLHAKDAAKERCSKGPCFSHFSTNRQGY